MDKDFTDPHKLGFMRVLEVFFVINITLTAMSLVVITKNHWDLSFDHVLRLIDLIFEAVSLWLIVNRKQYSRQIIIALAAVNIVIGCGHELYTGTFNPFMQLIFSASDIVYIVYFATSRRAKAVLVRPFSTESAQKELEEARGFYRLRSLEFWRNIIIYFCVFSVVGHWFEAAYCTLIKYGIMPGTYDPESQIWSDWLYPFMVYGFGFCACVLLLFPVKCALRKHIGGTLIPLVLSFIFNALVCGAIELAMGLVLNQPDANGVKPLWDYSNMAFNFMGQICLLNTSGFGMIATVMTWVVYPACERLFAHLPKDAMNIVFIAIVTGFAILLFLYYVNIAMPSWVDDLAADYDAGDGTSLVDGIDDSSAAGSSGNTASMDIAPVAAENAVDEEVAAAADNLIFRFACRFC